ncbi:MAG: amidohydrolase family protein [Phenylobacterium sp.]|uniref:amidohydrolase family protein n=1 Tax=Phenylobacterium sp. TaxID=1871053 RepID=UPI00391AEFA5
MKLLRVAFLALVVIWPGATAASADGPGGEVVVYRGAILIDGTGAPPRPDMDIVVEGERIAAVRPAGQPAPAQARVVDASGLYVLPGLIDDHVHMATPPDAAQARGVLRRQLYSGVTAVRDMADDLRSVAELAREARTGEIPAPDIHFAALMAGPSFFDDPRTGAAAQGYAPGTAPWMQAVTPETDMPLAIAMARGTGADAVKIYANLDGAMVRRIAEEAHRQGLKVWSHGMVFPATPQEVLDARPDVVSHTCYLAYQLNAKKPGSYQDPTPVEGAAFANGVPPQMSAIFARMKAEGVILDATTRVYVEAEEAHARTGKGRPPRCASTLGFELTAQAYRAGVQIAAGTDGETDWREPYPSLHEELELLSRKVGMPNLEVIRSATQIGARAMGQEAQMGTVEPGKLANLVFVKADPVADIANLRTVAFTVKRGAVYKREAYRPITAEEGERP